jgi:hypothetical protein
MDVVIMPHKKNSIKVLSVSRLRLVFLSLPILLGAVYLAWFIHDYQSLKDRMRLMAKYEAENQQHSLQMVYMAERIGRIGEEIDDLEGHYESIKGMLDRVRGDLGPLSGMGGSDSALFRSDLMRSQSHRNLVRLMHRSLANLKVQVENTELKAAEVRRFLSLGLEDPEPRWKEGALALTDKQTIRKQLREVAIELGLDPSLALSMAKVESHYDPSRVSPKGAVGVLQVMPRFAWNEYSVSREWLFNPHVNIRVGLTWMRSLLNRFDHNLDLALAAYNAGVSRVVKAGYAVPPIRETQDYVLKVRQSMKNES